jgi:hypothetical protein
MLTRIELLTGQILAIAGLSSLCLFLLGYFVRRVKEFVAEIKRPAHEERGPR